MLKNQKNESYPVIGITMGDYNGIGSEVLIKALAHNHHSVKASFVIIGSASIVNHVNQALSQPISPIQIKSLSEIDKKRQNIFILDLFDNIKFDVRFGIISKKAGKAADKCLRKGIELANSNSIQALVTAPVSKKALTLAGNTYPGQTEMIAELTKTNYFAMMLLADEFKVGLVTTHCAISEVSKMINKETIFTKLKVIDHSLKNDFKITKPRIAVTSLNPHGGESGLFGNEEEHHILPAIVEAKNNGIEAFGPFSADTLFAKIDNSNYDAYLTMYHDQGLIPLKMRSFGKGVNFTAGLPIIRTSPDHGTAFDIAGKLIADDSSMREAIKIGYQLAKKRTIS